MGRVKIIIFLTITFPLFFSYCFTPSVGAHPYKYVCKKITHPTFGITLRKCIGFKK